MAIEKVCDRNVNGQPCGKPILLEKNQDTDKWEPLNLDGSPHTHPRPQGMGGGGTRPMRTEAELHDIRREAVLNAAVAFSSAKIRAGAEIKSADVVQIARLFLSFVEEGRPRP